MTHTYLGFYGEPADRLIVTTVIAHNGTLLTYDDHILSYKWRGPGAASEEMLSCNSIRTVISNIVREL